MLPDASNPDKSAFMPTEIGIENKVRLVKEDRLLRDIRRDRNGGRRTRLDFARGGIREYA